MYSFQYRLISCYVLLLISLAVYAQSGKESFAGRVVDTETYQPVSFATIRLLSLPDSTLLVGGATDINGKFQLSFIRKTPNKSLLLHVSFVGYKPVYQLVFNSQRTIILTKHLFSTICLFKFKMYPIINRPKINNLSQPFITFNIKFLFRQRN